MISDMLKTTVNGRGIKFWLESFGLLKKSRKLKNTYILEILVHPDTELTDYEREVLARIKVLKQAIKREAEK